MAIKLTATKGYIIFEENGVKERKAKNTLSFQELESAVHLSVRQKFDENPSFWKKILFSEALTSADVPFASLADFIVFFDDNTGSFSSGGGDGSGGLIIDDLTTGGSTNSLSAQQGVVLKSLTDSKASIVQLDSVKVDPTQFSNSEFYEAENGMYNPVLKAEQLSALSGLSTHASGGVIATTAGVSGSGSIYLPKAIDLTKSFKAAVLVELNDSNALNISFTNETNETWSGFKASASTAGISANIDASVWLNQYGFTGGIPIGTKVWFVLTYDGANFLQAQMIPEDLERMLMDCDNGSPSPAFQAAWDNRGVSITYLPTLLAGNNLVFGGAAQPQNNLCRFNVTNTSVNNRVLGIWWSEGLGNPKDGQLKPLSVVRTKIGNDDSAWFLLPKNLSYSQVDRLMCFHPNGNSGGFSCITGSNGNLPEIAKIWKSGQYLLFGISGTDVQTIDNWEGALCSNWGSAVGMNYRNMQEKWLLDNIPGTRKLNLLGQSMGCLNAVRYAIQYPNQVNKIIGIAGAWGLEDCYAIPAFVPIINNAFGSFFNVENAISYTTRQVITVSANAVIAATTVSVNALTEAISANSKIVLKTGTGEAIVTVTASAAVGATSLAVTALTVAITAGATYDSCIVTTATAAINATSITVSALSYKIPSGSVLTLNTGTGQTKVITTANVSKGATSISITALTVAITSGASYTALINLHPCLNFALTTASSGATSVTLSGGNNVPYAVPIGTVFTKISGTGPTTITVTETVSPTNTAITCSPLASAITAGARYSTDYHYKRLNLGVGGKIPDIYYHAPYGFGGAYAQGVTFNVNKIVVAPLLYKTANTFSTPVSSDFNFVDPKKTTGALKFIPMKIWHGDSDTLINISQATSFRSAVIASGGTCDLVTVTGGTHLGSEMYDGDEIVNFLDI
jgi:hypothetical protein